MSEEGQAQEQPKTYENSLSEARAILDREDAPPPEPIKDAPIVDAKEHQQEPEPEPPVVEAKEEPPEPVVEIDPDIPLFEIEEVKEGGEKEVVKRSLNELKKERMMHADYTRKTQEIAAQRKAIPEEVKKLAAPVVQNAEQALMLANQVIQELVAPELIGLTPQKMAELSQNDPAEFARLLGKQNLVASHVQQLSQKTKQLNEYKENQRLQELTKVAQESIEVLSKEIPNWGSEVYGSLLNTGSEYGFQPNELGQVSSVADLKPVYFTDARIIRLLADAQKYREIQKGKPALDKKVAVVPKVIKPGTSEKPDSKTDAKDKALSRLRKSGSTSDAIEAAKHFL